MIHRPPLGTSHKQVIHGEALRTLKKGLFWGGEATKRVANMSAPHVPRASSETTGQTYRLLVAAPVNSTNYGAYVNGCRAFFTIPNVETQYMRSKS